MTELDKKYMKRAIALAQEGMDENIGGPFGAVVVKDGKVIAEGCNQVTSTHDPTAHAEVVAIRKACALLGDYQLLGCTVYTSCEPCPMCLGAIYWARADRVVYACTKEDAAAINFDDQFIYEELDRPISARKVRFDQMMQNESVVVFKNWADKIDKDLY